MFRSQLARAVLHDLRASRKTTASLRHTTWRISFKSGLEAHKSDIVLLSINCRELAVEYEGKDWFEITVYNPNHQILKPSSLF